MLMFFSFALYHCEYGENCRAPNKRCVHISYLDSVHFMKPQRLQTFVYHEILISYLDYARQRGFATARIWSCPALEGDDYILYAKPDDQKTRRDSRLQQWFSDMLVEGQRRNVVGKVTNVYDLYFAKESLDATAVPYLEGDYFPGEAERIIKGELENGVKTTGNEVAGSVKKLKNDMETQGDRVMVKLGEMIKPIKENCFVAFLNLAEAAKKKQGSTRRCHEVSVRASRGHDTSGRWKKA